MPFGIPKRPRKSGSRTRPTTANQRGVNKAPAKKPTRKPQTHPTGGTVKINPAKHGPVGRGSAPSKASAPQRVSKKKPVLKGKSPGGFKKVGGGRPVLKPTKGVRKVNRRVN